VLAGCIAAIGLWNLTIETDATTWFPKGSPVRESYNGIRESLSGISPMNIVIESTDNSPVTDPRAMSAIAGLTEYLESLPEVGRALAVSDPLRQLNRGFLRSEDSPLPETQALTEQYLLLLESAEQLQDLVTTDRSAANIILRVNNNGSEDLQIVASKVDAWWKTHGPVGFSARATGIMYEFARSEDEIAFGQIRGLCFALASVGVVLLATFREIRLALTTLIANALPIFLAFGGMGLAGIPLDAGTVVVGNLAIGIAIDETLHLVSGLSAADPAKDSLEKALTTALEQCVPAIVYTTTAIVLGFGVLAFSEFSFTRNLGMLTVVVMFLCIVADLFLLPALLLGPARQRARTPASS